MMILFRNDDTAQVIIHTANMIPLDWNTLCQAVWKSPTLPLTKELDITSPGSVARIGSGLRFKQDLIRYLEYYGNRRTGQLVGRLQVHSFDAIRAAFIASVPTRIMTYPPQNKPRDYTSFGWPGLREILSSFSTPPSNEKSLIVAQVSSIASLGERWINHFLNILRSGADQRHVPSCRILFPTAENIRHCLGGYIAGASIHMKFQTGLAKSQLSVLRPVMVKWAKTNNMSPVAAQRADSVSDAGRQRVGPHIKTYIRYSDTDMHTIDWAMISSANLSRQAWGDVPNERNEVRICSYEAGVMVWPQLFDEKFVENDVDNTSIQTVGTANDGDNEGKAVMVPAFKMDKPTNQSQDILKQPNLIKLIGLRMPYDIPLVPYEENEDPWCNAIEHRTPDCCGQTLVLTKR